MMLGRVNFTLHCLMMCYSIESLETHSHSSYMIFLIDRDILCKYIELTFMAPNALLELH